jgi:hypothetical protein
MRRLLQGHKRRSAVVLHGLGGIGKTQLATKYTTRHKEKYSAIFWLNANDEDSLKLSFRDIAQRVLEDQEQRGQESSPGSPTPTPTLKMQESTPLPLRNRLRVGIHPFY